MGTDLIPMNTLKGAIHYRQDVHTDRGSDYTPPTATRCRKHDRAPAKGRGDVVVRRREHVPRDAQLDIVGGISYDTNKVLRATFLLGRDTSISTREA